jgi:hypothetical protein
VKRGQHSNYCHRCKRLPSPAYLRVIDRTAVNKLRESRVEQDGVGYSRVEAAYLEDHRLVRVIRHSYLEVPSREAESSCPEGL